MRVTRVTLRHFRNIQETSLVADPGINFLVGQNGQGKTSLIEALGYLATLRSFRGAKTEEVIRWDEPSGEIVATIEPDSGGGDWQTELKVIFSRGGRSHKAAFINGKAHRSSTQYLSQRFGSVELGFHTVVFNPSDHDLVRGEPQQRRAYLDRVIAAEAIEHLEEIQKYQKTLDQRNALLREEDQPSVDLLATFTEPLASLSARLAWRRLAWLQRQNKSLSATARRIAPDQPDLRVFYRSNWVPEIEHLSSSNNSLETVHFSGLPSLPSIEILEQSFWNQYTALKQSELRARTTLVGVHRDDWFFVFGGQQLKGHGSQGEVRTALLALKLCEIDSFQQTTGHRPVLLLDDFSSELDRQRRSFLLTFLEESKLQVFVTTTEDSVVLGRKFQVIGGKIE